MKQRIWMLGALVGILGLPLHAATASAAAVVTSSDAARTIVISDLVVHDGSVSGTITNKTTSTVRGVDLLLHQDWQWTNERHPGVTSPGRSMPFALAGDIAPNSSTPFTFQTPQLPKRSDGQFVTTMNVVRFSEVGP